MQDWSQDVTLSAYAKISTTEPKLRLGMINQHNRASTREQ